MQHMAQWSPARRQRGLTAIGGLVVLVLVVGGIILTLKLVPHYLDFYTMQSVLEGMPAKDVRAMNRGALNDAIEKRFKINNLRDFKISDIINVERSRDITVLEVNYERREHLFFNIDVVITFEKSYEYSN
ncbi:MAG: DUF4845 domain-containing protein [Gammaproteobacteria bacterium]|nr:DUF4845 domain-containing protein [Gammaproteobacteria bacterium]